MNKKSNNTSKGKKGASSSSNSTIALNKKAKYEYAIEQRMEAGIVLEGWEVKSIRQGKVQIAESYVLLKKGEVWLIGSVIQPLQTVSTHIKADPQRTRKLLLNKREIKSLIGYVERKGYAIIPTCMYWKKNKVKVEIALGKGKKAHDKRATTRERDWSREKQRILKKA